MKVTLKLSHEDIASIGSYCKIREVMNLLEGRIHRLHSNICSVRNSSNIEKAFVMDPDKGFSDDAIPYKDAKEMLANLETELRVMAVERQLAAVLLAERLFIDIGILMGSLEDVKSYFGNINSIAI